MATLAENAAAVKAAQVAIDAAIVAKGGMTTGGLSNAAAAIAALPSGGGDETMKQFLDKSLVNLDAAQILGYDATSPAITPNSYFFQNFKALKTVYAPMFNLSPSNTFMGCSSLEDVTLRSGSSSAAHWNGCTSLANITFKEETAARILSWTALLAGVPNTCVFHGSDKDVKYIDGAWTIVERN